MNSEIRKDYIQEKYVIIAPRRGKRPHDTPVASPAASPIVKDCAFCPARSNKLAAKLIIGSKKDWRIKVIPNKFPVVTNKNPKAYGYHEVVIETPKHTEHFEELPIERISELLEVYAQRTEEISKDPKIQYLLIFKNMGGKAGASIYHAHSQIFATEFLPPNLLDKSQKVQEYKLKHGTCVYDDVIKKETKGPRLVYRDEHVIAFTPYASQHNYEIWIMPLRHLDNITVLNEAERHSWAKALKKIVLAIDELRLPYNFYFHQVVNDEDQHLYMKITPRGSVWAGVEIGSGVIINPVAPEHAAAFYRRHVKSTK